MYAATSYGRANKTTIVVRGSITHIIKRQLTDLIQNLTFSILYLDKATEAISTASCCIGSDMSAFFITAFLCSAMLENQVS